MSKFNMGESNKETLVFALNRSIRNINLSENMEEFERLYNKMEGAIDFAYAIDVIDIKEWAEACGRLLHETILIKVKLLGGNNNG